MKKRMIAMLLTLIMVLGTGTLSVAAIEGEGVEEPAAVEVEVEAAEDQAEASDVDAEEAITEKDPQSQIEDNTGEEPPAESGETVKPIDLTASATVNNDGGVTFTVTQDEAISYYVIRAMKNGVVDTSVPELKVAAAEISSAVFSGLDGIYAFEVEAFHEETPAPAEGEDASAAAPVVTSLGKAVTEEVYAAKVKDLKIYPSHRAIAVEWTPVGDATSYEVYRNGELLATVGPESVAYDNDEIMAYYDDKDMPEQPDLPKYTYTVKAKSGDAEAAPSDEVKGSSIQQEYVRITFKAKAKLTSHNTGIKNKTHTFNKGQTVYAHGYLLGKHQFYYNINGVNYLFYTKYTRVKSPSGQYTKSIDYDTRAAEYFVNFHKNQDGSIGMGSSTNYMIWVNRYTQHLYVFERAHDSAHPQKKWQICTLKASKYNTGKTNGGSDIYNKKKGIDRRSNVYNNWEVSTGRSSAPSPTGSYTIKKRTARKGGHKWWNFYHSETAIHGKVKGTVFGQPMSMGCIRNPDLNAEFIYFNIPKKSKVLVY